MLSIWDFETERKRKEKERKKTLRLIGTQVDTFFIDEAPRLGFEERIGQWEMACEIVQAMIERKHILVEAGVGIGKTYAYIVPLLLYHKNYNKPVIIATSTIALQEQLADDLLKIENILDYYPDVIIAKGQNHFLCRNRFESYFFGKKNKEEYKYYEIINRNGCQKSEWDIEIPDKIWNSINVSAFNPTKCFNVCPHRDYCYYYQLRDQVKKTNGFILCNQDLLAMNMRKRASCSNEIFASDHEYIIIDEAHNLESRVRSSYTINYTYSECANIIQDVERINKNMGYVLEKIINRFYDLIDNVFSSLLMQIKYQDQVAEKKDKIVERYYVSKEIEDINDLVTTLFSINDMASMAFGVKDTYRTRGENVALEELENMSNFFMSMSKKDSKDIFWMNATKKTKYDITISSCPKNVNELIEQLLFSSSDFRTIMTSATISNDGDHNYDYFISNTNLPVNDTLICDSKKSPFEYNSRVLIYYTEDIPNPNSDRKSFIKAGVEEIIKLLNITDGKALILFTAKQDMLDVYELLQEKVTYNVLMQNDVSSQNDIIKEFKADINSVLLGVGTYWEGISIEGKALSNLIVFRLPFPVPEPIVDYKRSISRDGLMDVLVPEMIIKLKQGIGRLIRNKDDYGIVSIIDPRLGEKSKVPYKQFVWSALPIENKTNDIKKVENFYKSLTKRYC